MADRKAELERKKAKLAAMREEKKRKEDEKKRTSVGTPTGSATTPLGDLSTETDELLKNLGISSESSAPAAAAVVSSDIIRSSPARDTGQTKKLTVSQVTQTVIPSQEGIVYAKETQTLPLEPERDNRSMDFYVDSPKFLSTLEWEDEFSHHMSMLTYEESDRDGETVDAQAALAELQRMPHVQGLVGSEQEPRVEKPRELSEEEKNQILLSDTFVRFFDRSSRVMERALAEEVDVFMDYFGGEVDVDSAEVVKPQLKLSRVFSDDRWSRQRCVTSLDWCTKFPELCLASYNSNEEALNEPDGVALIWNIKFKKTSPEYVFHCHSPVTTACFARFHPNLIIGGTYNGQLVLWDSRTSRRTPVQRSPLSTQAHTHPVCAVSVVGSENAHNLVSVSTDGRVCTWSLDMLSQPQEVLDLQRQARPVPATCLDFQLGDANHFVIGAEDYGVYTGCRHGNKAGISDFLEGHHGPVTAVATHKAPGPVDFSHLVLSASFDWTIRLWSSREPAPIYCLEENSDYVMDVAWSPVNPALFCAVDCNGRVDLWNLNMDTESPVARVINPAAVSCCRFHEGGALLAGGDITGGVSMYELSEGLAAPRPEEWKLLSRTLTELRQTTSELGGTEPDTKR